MHALLEKLKSCRGWIVTLCLFAVLTAFILCQLSNVERKTLTQRQAALKDAALRAAVACYSVEGVYPDSADYLTEHYGLHYDESMFILQYDAFADNILPDIRVLVRGAE